MWLIWLGGGVLLVAAGAATTLVPRWRTRQQERRIAWSAARAAIDSAAVSRDAAPRRVAEAERLMSQAELVAADHGGVDAARLAARYAQQADRLWRAGHDD
ncbi:hypothetical protein GA0074692_1909 [Micromonospora pallida]|uniref:Uncharacterized protein n=1 Tax=Micromonospora pallida TaxID=145854 RepID=A0A1C6S6R1_9ACTN|nr:DUF6403 family protein [Micromonospora pallida]SCL25174.1 hypothetical protein GA0074692_1909 [Micromonospora pallida]